MERRDKLHKSAFSCFIVCNANVTVCSKVVAKAKFDRGRQNRGRRLLACFGEAGLLEYTSLAVVFSCSFRQCAIPTCTPALFLLPARVPMFSLTHPQKLIVILLRLDVLFYLAWRRPSPFQTSFVTAPSLGP